MSCIVTGTLKKSPLTLLLTKMGTAVVKQSLYLAAHGCQTSALLGAWGAGPPVS